MAEYKLTYFDVRGRAELSRLLLTYAGKKFEDKRVTGEEFAAMKSNLPFEQLPILECGKDVLAQSNAIARHLAREFSLDGKTNLDKAKCDMYIEYLEDMFREVAKTYFMKDEKEKAEALKKLEETTLPKFIAVIERDIKKNGGKNIVGSAVTVADLAVLCGFDAPSRIFPKLLEKYPVLKKFRESIEEDPKLKDYLKSRKETVV